MLAELQAEAKVTLAPITVKWKLPRMLPRQVTSQGLRNGKAFSALKAAIWFDASVYE